MRARLHASQWRAANKSFLSLYSLNFSILSVIVVYSLYKSFKQEEIGFSLLKIATALLRHSGGRKQVSFYNISPIQSRFWWAEFRNEDILATKNFQNVRNFSTYTVIAFNSMDCKFDLLSHSLTEDELEEINLYQANLKIEKLDEKAYFLYLKFSSSSWKVLIVIVVELEVVL